MASEHDFKNKTFKMLDSYFETTANQEEDINKEFNIKQKEVEEMVEMIKSWVQQQPHLPKEKGPHFEAKLKFMLRCNKMSIEKTKRKLDFYYSVGNLFPELFENSYPLHPKIKQAMNDTIMVPLRRVPDNFTRIYFIRLTDANTENFCFLDVVRMSINMFELRANFDFCNRECSIFDMKGISAAHIKAINPLLLVKLVQLYQKSIPDRIVGLHFLNVPTFFIPLINTVASVLKEKIASRLHIHQSLETLYEYIPKRVLPADYGGDDISSLEMRDAWIYFCEINNEWLVNRASLKSNEELRPAGSTTDTLFGMEGSFRKLDID